MEFFIFFILNIIVFVFSIVLKLLLHSLRLSLKLVSGTLNGVSKGALISAYKAKGLNGALQKGSSLAVYLSLKAAVSLLNVVCIALDILLVILSTLGYLWGSLAILTIIAIIAAGSYILLLNDCKSFAADSNSNTSVSSNSAVSKGDSASAGQGDYTEEAGNWAKSWDLTYIGDSLGAGSEAQFKELFPNATYDADPSRGLVSIRGQKTGETGIDTLKRLVKEGKVKDNLVVALGTNNDLSVEALQQFYSEIPTSVKTITWVLTASEGTVDSTSINTQIKDFVNSHENMRYLDWKSYVASHGGWNSYQGGDNIHMSADGYAKYVKFEAQGLYDLYGKGSSSSKSTKTATGGIFSDTMRLLDIAKDKVQVAYNLTVWAEEDESSEESETNTSEDTDTSTSSSEDTDSKSSKSSKKSGCNFTTSKVDDTSSSSSNDTSVGGVGYLYKAPYTVGQGFGPTHYAASGAYAIFENGWHSGVDMSATTGTRSDILSATDGEVYYTGDDLSIAYFLVVKINGGFLTYEHLADPASKYWKVGDKIKRGDVVGREAGSANGSTDTFASHLHLQYNPGDKWTLASLTSGFKSPEDYLVGFEKDKVKGTYYEDNRTTITPK